MKKLIFSYTFIVCLLTLAMVDALFIEWYPLERLEARLYDSRLKLHRINAPSPVVIVGIDEESVRKMGPLPWPRAYIAFMVRRLHEYGAKVIGVDILYSERDYNPGLAAIKDIIRKIKAERLPDKEDRVVEIFAALLDAERRLDNDALLTAALRDTRNVVLPLSFILNGPPGSQATADRSGLIGRSSLQGAVKGAPVAKGVITPLQQFADSALALGHVNHAPDRDGVLRRESLFINYQDRAVPSFGLQLLLKYLDRDIKELSITEQGFSLGTLTIPTDHARRLLINNATRRPITSLSFSDVAQGTVPAGAFTNKLVLLGYRTPAAGSPFRTAPPPVLSDIDFTAHVLTTMLSGKPVVRPHWAFPLEAGVLVFFGALFTVLVPRVRPITGAVAVILALSLWGGAAVALFILKGYWVKPTYAAALVTLCALGRIITGVRGRESEEDIPETDVIENGALRLVVGARTDTGRIRDHNEDSFCVERTIGLLAVADGVGGESAGEVASARAIDALRNCLKRAEGEGKKPDNGSNGRTGDTLLLGEAVRYANRIVYETAQQTPQWQKMGTTVAAALVREGRMSIAHAGDSRVYLVRSGSLEQLTDDHSLVQPSMKHVLTRALGVGAEVEVDLHELALSEGDIIILCTDGLSTMVSESELLAAVTAGRDPFKTCTKLIAMANRNGGRDNITAIVAYVYKRGAASQPVKRRRNHE
ncbi:MAG: CHASE2 domain-containing protein [Nitrospirota bacterium]